jgi:hypothetical protein
MAAAEIQGAAVLKIEEMYMHMARIYQSILILLLFSFTAEGQVRVTHLSGSDDLIDEEGVVYNLPQTSFRIDFKATKVSEFAGPFSEYAENLLGIRDVIKQTNVIHLLEAAELTCFTKPDPNHFYHVSLTEKAEKNLLMRMDPDGVLLGVEMVGKDAGDKRIVMEGDEFDYEMFRHYSPVSLVERTDTVFRKVAIDTNIYESTILRRRLEPKSEEKKAREALAIINQLKEDKYNLLVGYQETAYSRDALDYMIRRLENMEREYLEMFTGVRLTETIDYTLYFTPSKEDKNSDVPLLSFSSKEGFSDDGNRNISILFEPVEATGDKAESTAEPKEPGSGLRYRLPGHTDCKILFSNEVLFEKVLLINQFGVVRALPAYVTDVTFDPKTGNIRSVLLNRE